MNAHSLRQPPARWESWVQWGAILLALLGGIWTTRGILDDIEARQQLMLVHLCRLEVVLHQLTFEECRAMLNPGATTADAPKLTGGGQ